MLVVVTIYLHELLAKQDFIFDTNTLLIFKKQTIYSQIRATESQSHVNTGDVQTRSP